MCAALRFGPGPADPLSTGLTSRSAARLSRSVGPLRRPADLLRQPAGPLRLGEGVAAETVGGAGRLREAVARSQREHLRGCVLQAHPMADADEDRLHPVAGAEHPADDVTAV